MIKKGRMNVKHPLCSTISSCQVIPRKLPRSGLRRRESLLVVASVCVSVNFREVFADNLLPAAVAASCSSQQWEKVPGRRVERAGGRVSCSRRRQRLALLLESRSTSEKNNNWLLRHYGTFTHPEIRNDCVSTSSLELNC